MAEDVLQELIKQVETLTPDEQLRLARHLEERVRAARTGFTKPQGED